MTIERNQSTFSYPSKFIDVIDNKMHYVEVGEGKPFLFLHGVPSSCYLWRNILPHLAPLGRCIAVDLIGFGKSSKPDIAYSIQDHIKYIDGFIEALNLHSITLVMHGLGSIVGLDYAMRHQKNCIGIAMYEPFLSAGEMMERALPYEEQVQHWRNKITDKNIIDVLLQSIVMRKMSEEELAHYREPFNDPGSIKPITEYLNELSLDHTNSEMDKIIRQYSSLLTKSKLPKLLLYTIPGFILTMEVLMWARESLPNIEVTDLGEELHFAQESYPDLMGETISVWWQGVEQGAIE